jgi:hypothetical protein
MTFVLGMGSVEVLLEPVDKRLERYQLNVFAKPDKPFG